MASDFIENVQKIDEIARLLSKIGPVTLEEAVSRVKTISEFIDRYGEMGPILDRLKEIESRLFMLKDMFTLDEAAEYLGASKSLLYKMTASRGLTHYKPNGRVIYIDRKDLDELLRTNPIYSKKALERQAVAATIELSQDKGRKVKGKAK